MCASALGERKRVCVCTCISVCGSDHCESLKTRSDYGSEQVENENLLFIKKKQHTQKNNTTQQNNNLSSLRTDS